MTPLEIAQEYFDAWNQRDATAVLATLGSEGTYADPMTKGPIRGTALASYINGLVAAFPDLSFEIASVGLAAPDLVAAQWIMRGTNTGSMMGLPPTGRRIEVPGADFIRVSGDSIASVQGYFDSRAVPDQIGLQVVVQPHAVGPFSFGTAVRAWAGASAQPGAFSITTIQARTEEESREVAERSRQIATEMLSLPGFLGFVGVTLGDRMMTITAWADAESPRQVMSRGHHGDAVQQFFGGGLGGGGFTSVFVPGRINTMWVRCGSCQRMANHATSHGLCTCGEALPEPIPYW